MDKQHILDEIKRTAEKNGGRPLGKQRFFTETGIKEQDWYGKYWARWGDALKEAGYSPNTLQGSYEEDWLLEQMILLIKELGRFPVVGELRLKARNDKGFPSHTAFRRLGNKTEWAKKILEYCRLRSGYDDVISVCQPIINNEFNNDKEETEDSNLGYVYLIKSGRYYKIGRSNYIGRREYELSIQLPEKATTEHVIKTDDPVGIEAYWHGRFREKRKNGEW